MLHLPSCLPAVSALGSYLPGICLIIQQDFFQNKMWLQGLIIIKNGPSGLLPTPSLLIIVCVLISIGIISLYLMLEMTPDSDLDWPGYSASPCEDPNPSAGRMTLGSDCHQHAETPNQGEDNLEEKSKDKIYLGLCLCLFADAGLLQKQPWDWILRG